MRPVRSCKAGNLAREQVIQMGGVKTLTEGAFDVSNFF
jgi:hypothetical protein